VAHRAVLDYLRRHARDIVEADREDLASDVLEALLEKSASEDIDDLTAFAVGVAKAKLLNAIRKRDRRERAVPTSRAAKSPETENKEPATLDATGVDRAYLLKAVATRDGRRQLYTDEPVDPRARDVNRAKTRRA
jgi:DNA-directed RNA polymerase specialized sigma24 family protein